MLRVERLTKIFENVTDQIAGGIREASFALEPGAFFTMLGPSGCGKTTTLRCIAGLEMPDDGRITVDGRTLFDSAAKINRAGRAARRRHGVPVLRNLAAHDGARRTSPSHSPSQSTGAIRRPRSSEAVARALAIVDLDGFQERPAPRLSGGQQQRVALARAVVHEPRLLLLDEPLSNLDAQLRDEMRGELKRLQSKIGITTIYVTHDQSEALALSDTIAVIDQGRIRQVGSPQDIYFRPADAFVARFVGATNLLAGNLLAAVDGRGRRRNPRPATDQVPEYPGRWTTSAAGFRFDPAGEHPAGGPWRRADECRRQLHLRSHPGRNLPRRHAPRGCGQRRYRPPGHSGRRPAAAGGRGGGPPVRAGAGCRFAGQGVVEHGASAEETRSTPSNGMGQVRKREQEWPRNTRRSKSKRARGSPG